MNKKTNHEDEWIQFSTSFFCIADIACTEMLNPTEDGYEISQLYIPTIFNIKHGLESSIKSFIVILEKKELDKDKWHHDQVKNFESFRSLLENKEILKRIEERMSKIDKKEILKYFPKYFDLAKEFSKQVELLKDLLDKYYYCEFLKEKIDSAYRIEDFDNTVFKYPQNKLKMKLDYASIIPKINKLDISLMKTDIILLKSLLYFFWIVFEFQLEGNY